jgi:UDP-glucose 4-epimerase
MKKVLITGGAGFIGSHVADAYSARGYAVVVADKLPESDAKNVAELLRNPNNSYAQVDIREKDALAQVFERHRPEIVSHHAAQKSVPYSVENPPYDAGINIVGLLNVLELAGQCGVRTFLYVSSGGALSKAVAEGEKSKETDMPQLESPYAISKFAGEGYVHVYAGKFGFDYSILRYANVYGPRQIADGECGVTPLFVSNVLAGRTSKLMTYPDMPRGCTRDYVYVGDVVAANMLLTDKPSHCPVNIGSGVETSVMDVYEGILSAFNADVPIDIVGPRAGDLKRAVLDTTRIHELVGWTAKVDLKTGLSLLRDSYKI